MFNDNDRLQQMEDNWNNEIYGHDKMERLEYMEQLQERADEFRKDDSEPDFLEGVQVCRIDDPSCEVCQ